MDCDFRRLAAGIEFPDRWIHSHAGRFSRAHRAEARAPYQMVLGGKVNPSHIMQKLEDRAALFILL
jgi:hypothetical protein